MRRLQLLLATLFLMTPLATLAPAHADSAGAYVEGRLLDAAGHGLSGTGGIAWCRTGGGGHDRLGCTSHVVLAYFRSGSDGFYTAELPGGFHRRATGRGHYLLFSDHPVKRSLGRIASPRPGHDLTVSTRTVRDHPAAVPSDAVITGTVTTSTGAAAAAFVDLTLDGVPRGRALTDAAGRYVLSRSDLTAPVAADDHVVLTVEPYGAKTYVSAPFTLPSSGSVTRDVVVTSFGTVTGRIQVAHAHRAWRARLLLLTAGKRRYRATTDARGHLHLSVPPGTYPAEVTARRLHPRKGQDGRIVWTSPTTVTVTSGGITRLGRIRVG